MVDPEVGEVEFFVSFNTGRFLQFFWLLKI